MAAGATVGGGKKGGLPQTAAMMNLLTDMAFNLLIFFVVLADPSSETGRPQKVPASTENKANETQAKTVEVKLFDPDKTGNKLNLNGDAVGIDELKDKLAPLLKDKPNPDDRIVAVTSTPDTPYFWWVKVTALIEQANGVVALQLEEEKEVTVK